LDKPILLADENVHAGIVDKLRKSGFEVYSIRETMGGASDMEVLQKATSIPAILVTEDSDFGELIFSHGIPAIGVIYLRYSWSELDEIVKALMTVFSEKVIKGSFFTITSRKIRERTLP
jgi:predicted nuclease of predicted toxin-antitoxin system